MFNARQLFRPFGTHQWHPIFVLPLGVLSKNFNQLLVIYPDFPLDLTGFFLGKHWSQFSANMMQNFGISF